jgi:hypothetical protein
MTGYFSEVLQGRRYISLVDASCLESCMQCLRDSVFVEIVELVLVLVPKLIYNSQFVIRLLWDKGKEYI